MNVYELMIRRDKLTDEIKVLSEKTNGNFGRHVSILDVLSSKQSELKEIEDEMKKIEYYNDEFDMINKMKSKEKQDEFEIIYEKYKKSVENSSGGLVTTDKHDLVKFYSFYSEVIYPDMMKLFKAVAGAK